MPMRTDHDVDSINYLWMQGDGRSPSSAFARRSAATNGLASIAGLTGKNRGQRKRQLDRSSCLSILVGCQGFEPWTY
ncbi:hypothetical protein LA76x_1869 [Lysobacter antibioticus]|uniref:Uncharacterized protein n=1 Tax=Lysobacter antibioticus TaxID=84531 RepID=A0A0S2F8Z5_LYSAN|nr:hypothetical protein LA76x_1869 [Lysobacter antibioticus]